MSAPAANTALLSAGAGAAAGAARSKLVELKAWVSKGPLALKVLAFGACV